MKRLLQGVIVLALLAACFTYTGFTKAPSAHACGYATATAPVWVSGVYLGEAEVEVSCGSAAADAWPASGVYVNHLWLRDANNNYVSPDRGGGTGGRGTDWYTIHTWCAYGEAIFQSGSYWGGASTSCIDVNQ